jgi:hypothetical protein
MIGAQVVALILWAGFVERHRSRRRPADHDFLDPLRAVALGSRRWRNWTTTRLNRPPTGPAGGRRHQPAPEDWRKAEVAPDPNRCSVIVKK